jgi:Malic enzyme, N-terminal domain
VLDVGTDNHERLADPEYIGWRHERIDGEDHFDFVERFVKAVEQELPGTLMQWEDFATPHARPILERYRDRLLTFNDDIQGTAAVVVGALAGARSNRLTPARPAHRHARRRVGRDRRRRHAYFKADEAGLKREATASRKLGMTVRPRCAPSNWRRSTLREAEGVLAIATRPARRSGPRPRPR